jgi:hypothetical protein
MSVGSGAKTHLFLVYEVLNLNLFFEPSFFILITRRSCCVPYFTINLSTFCTIANSVPLPLLEYYDSCFRFTLIEFDIEVELAVVYSIRVAQFLAAVNLTSRLVSIKSNNQQT